MSDDSVTVSEVKRPQGTANYEADKAKGLTYSYEQDKRNIKKMWEALKDD